MGSGKPGTSPVGFFIAALIVIVIADYAPHLVNWLLALILAGLVLKNSDTWVPILNKLGGGTQPQTQQGK